ncbi:MAG: hypothetical protein GVY07_15970 [Bacteroidetes bacterium]|jgi:uncharacterized BrkB/YihY/UPF0761 family membrane protein|nr:hypothetical protein [Bacteroidota bacterium]
MKKLLKRILSILIGFQGLSGLAGGFGLMLDPTGEALGIPQRWLGGSMFDTYFIPGVILFVVLGIFPMICYVGLWKQKSWAISGSFVTGVALVIWIFVEIYMIGYHSNPPLQLIYGLTGILIILVSWIRMVGQPGKT